MTILEFLKLLYIDASIYPKFVMWSLTLGFFILVGVCWVMENKRNRECSCPHVCTTCRCKNESDKSI